jgi:hypothetical protein
VDESNGPSKDDSERSLLMTVSGNGQKTMKRVVVDHFGGPEVLNVVEDP